MVAAPPQLALPAKTAGALPSQPTLYVVCSNRPRNGKTLLARVLVDFLLIEERDPFVIDAGYPAGKLRAAFPGRTALIDFDQVQGQMKLFDTILTSVGRDYVLDLPAHHLEHFFDMADKLAFFAEARKSGYQIVVFFVVDHDASSRQALIRLRDRFPDLFFAAVRNQLVGSSLLRNETLATLAMPELDAEAVSLIEDKRFSVRAFMLGDVASIPQAYRLAVKSFFETLFDGFSDLKPALSLLKLRH